MGARISYGPSLVPGMIVISSVRTSVQGQWLSAQISIAQSLHSFQASAPLPERHSLRCVVKCFDRLQACTPPIEDLHAAWLCLVELFLIIFGQRCCRKRNPRQSTNTSFGTAVGLAAWRLVGLVDVLLNLPAGPSVERRVSTPSAIPRSNPSAKRLVHDLSVESDCHTIQVRNQRIVLGILSEKTAFNPDRSGLFASAGSARAPNTKAPVPAPLPSRRLTHH